LLPAIRQVQPLLHQPEPVLRAALRKRGPNDPPVEELLLALAHLHQKQPDEARKHLHTAVAWMRRGAEPSPCAPPLWSGWPLVVHLLPWAAWLSLHPITGSFRSTAGLRMN
jgi:hypothetical protein